MAATEEGHHANRSYKDQDGTIHLNDSTLKTTETTNVTGAELDAIGDVTLGTAAASKVMSLDSSSEIDQFGINTRLTFNGANIQHAAPVTTTANLVLTNAVHAGKVIFSNKVDLSITLPVATTAKIGEEYTLMSQTISTGQGTRLAVTSADAINGGTSGKGLDNSGTTDAIGDSVTVKSNGTGWYTIGQRGTWDAES